MYTQRIVACLKGFSLPLPQLRAEACPELAQICRSSDGAMSTMVPFCRAAVN